MRKSLVFFQLFKRFQHGRKITSAEKYAERNGKCDDKSYQQHIFDNGVRCFAVVAAFIRHNYCCKAAARAGVCIRAFHAEICIVIVGQGDDFAIGIGYGERAGRSIIIAVVGAA